MNNSAITSRIPLWDNLKLLAMTIVIISHALDGYPELYGRCESLFSGGGILLIISTLFVVRMPLLTIISGYFYKERDTVSLLKNYLYPCILFSIIEIISWQIFHAPARLYLFGWTMWYLWALFWYMLLTPIFLKKCSLKVLIVITSILAIVVGFTPLEYTFQLSRLVCFYPFYLLGIFLKEHETYIYSTNRKHTPYLIILIIALVATGVLFYFYPSMKQYTNFSYGYSNGISFLKRIVMYVICIVSSVSLILSCSNREFWFTKYGSRTMNAYLGHMAFIILPISFGLIMPYQHTWYGYLLNVIGVPLLCCILYTDFWKKIIDKIIFR